MTFRWGRLFTEKIKIVSFVSAGLVILDQRQLERSTFFMMVFRMQSKHQNTRNWMAYKRTLPSPGFLTVILLAGNSGPFLTGQFFPEPSALSVPVGADGGCSLYGRQLH
jgi:hypothetical protein